MSRLPILAVTPGEPAGIGPDLCVALAQTQPATHEVVICDPEMLGQRADRLGLTIRLDPWDGSAGEKPRRFILPLPVGRPVQPGRLDSVNAGYVLKTLERAVDGCMHGEFDALVTGPVHKGVINEAGIAFTGHTEFLAQRSGSAQPVMMLACPGLRVALTTIHVPLAQVSSLITQDRVAGILTVLHRDLQSRFGIPNPMILVCGLNPHAGESGHLGHEELEIISPVIDRLARKGLRLRGPVPADTAFIPAQLKDADAVLTMYHDQGLPVLKHRDFANAVNVTLGLPFVRTSVDHGTALELAGTGQCDTSSMRAALEMARTLASGNAPQVGTLSEPDRPVRK
ncbi:MAG: 4-hydroxythreonine-4-phosphate dehydrogenase PdxA [Acidiferrobacterales bacterium]